MLKQCPSTSIAHHLPAPPHPTAGRIAEAEHLYLERSHFEAACRLQDMEQDEDAYPEDVELARYGLTVITAGLKLTAAAAAAGGAQQSVS